jgi:hypothetical protein
MTDNELISCIISIDNTVLHVTWRLALLHVIAPKAFLIRT